MRSAAETNQSPVGRWRPRLCCFHTSRTAIICERKTSHFSDSFKQAVQAVVHDSAGLSRELVPCGAGVVHWILLLSPMCSTSSSHWYEHIKGGGEHVRIDAAVMDDAVAQQVARADNRTGRGGICSISFTMYIACEKQKN